MTNDDLKVEYRAIQDESVVQRDGTVKKFKRYDFYIGKFGPFVERFDLDTFTDTQIAARIVALKSHLANLPT